MSYNNLIPKNNLFNLNQNKNDLCPDITIAKLKNIQSENEK
jgi:hypothetical protein